VGNDFAGIVEELGPDVPEGVRTVGESVAGVVLGSQFSLLRMSVLPIHVLRARPQPDKPTAHSRNT
jgi:hypothetical protein